MRFFDYKKEYEKLLSADIVSLLTAIHEYKGKLLQITGDKAETLAQLVETAKIRSAGASNGIEGISASDDRLQKIVKGKTHPKTRSEKEIAGYRDVLSTIYQSYEYIPPRSSMILQLHRDLYKFTGSPTGGSYRNSDDCAVETDKQGSRDVRFQPVAAPETPEYVDAICSAYEDALCGGETDALALIPVFVLDFLRIRPFNDGNGRMSRLLTLLLLCRAGYTVGKYVSVEQLITDSAETYREALRESSYGWREGENDYAPFVRYFLRIIAAAYCEFEKRAALIIDGDYSKPERIREIIKERLGPITKSEIMKECPDISQVTVQRALNDLLKNGQIAKLGGGRYTKYVWENSKESAL